TIRGVMTKRIGIIGSGRFGDALVQALASQGAEIVLMDADRRKIQELSDYVTKAVEGDATNIHALEEAGFASCDTVVVAIGENIEGSVMATVNCKDLGVRTVVAKASSEVHGRVLRRVGADVVIFPNRDRAQRLARSLMTTSQVDLFEIADGLCAAEVPTPEAVADKTLAEADIRRVFDVTVLAVRRLDDADPAAPRQLLIPKADTLIRSDDRLLIFGTSEQIDAFAQA
ncbi:MAG: potassium channel family protein, partial [Candidatus Spyradenecus sp.]